MRLLSWITLPPLTLGAVYLAVANKERVLFNLDAFNPSAPALALDVPLFLVVLVSLLLGILIGGAAAWTAQGRWRKEAKATRKVVTQLSQDEQNSTEKGALSVISDVKAAG
ncbi:MAG: lipopolysaccharide assembly protein LapA domain-containing protein [Parvibaculum sp.]